jgi:hypothetical protein
VKNVQNVKSVVKRLLSAESNSSLNSSVKPILHQGEGSSVNASQTLPPPPATPSYRERAPAAAGNPDDSVNNGNPSLLSEDSQGGNGRESLGNSRQEEVNNVQGNRQFSEERRPSRNSRMLGSDIREARNEMRMVKDSQMESGMGGGTALGGLMDQELAVQATPIVKGQFLVQRFSCTTTPPVATSTSRETSNTRLDRTRTLEWIPEIRYAKGEAEGLLAPSGKLG